MSETVIPDILSAIFYFLTMTHFIELLKYTYSNE